MTIIFSCTLVLCLASSTSTTALCAIHFTLAFAPPPPPATWSCSSAIYSLLPRCPSSSRLRYDCTYSRLAFGASLPCVVCAVLDVTVASRLTVYFSLLSSTPCLRRLLFPGYGFYFTWIPLPAFGACLPCGLYGVGCCGLLSTLLLDSTLCLRRFALRS